MQRRGRAGGCRALAGLSGVLIVLASCSPQPTSEQPDDETPEVQGVARAVSQAERADRLWQKGEALERQGRLDERYQEAIDLGPYNEAQRYRFGSLFVRGRPLDEVEAYYREALARDPKPQTSHSGSSPLRRRLEALAALS